MLFKKVKEMSMEDYLEDSGQLCWTCKKACGLCSWSHHFEPIPGWTATPMRRNAGTSKGVPVIIDTYRIMACPLYLPDEPMRIPRKGSAY